jgi:hypothetical protein
MEKENDQSIFNELDNFISNTKPDIILDHALSIRDLQAGKQLYNQMKKDEKQKYEIFGYNAMGYTCFALYQNKEKNIYFIIVNIQTLSNYLIVENENIFN